MCDTCQDCGCNNITLPVAIGPVGPQGPQGPAGTGSDLVIVLHNDTSVSTTSSSTIALFSTTKAYTLPAGKLATNGSKLKVRALFSTTGSKGESSSTAYIYIGGSSFTSFTIPYRLEHYDRDLILEIDLLITRVSATELFITSNSLIADASGAARVLSGSVFTQKGYVVSNIDSNPLLIECRGKTIHTTSFNCDQLTIDHLIK